MVATVQLDTIMDTVVWFIDMNSTQVVFIMAEVTMVTVKKNTIYIYIKI